MPKYGAVFHQSISKKDLLTTLNIFTGEEDPTSGIHHLSGYGSLPGVRSIGEESQHKKTKYHDQRYGLKPGFGYKQVSFLQVFHFAPKSSLELGPVQLN